MGQTPYKVLETEAYLIYLRKSRADNQNESVEEILAKHEASLQELAEKELGGRIPEQCIFREVVSGETIEERPRMKEVLTAIENPTVKMVLVVDPSRLSRGDLMDCGLVVNTFKFTNTHIKTLQMTYDLSNKMHRKFFEQELMRGNDYLEYTKEILLRGRIRSILNGNYIGNNPPFGYDKAKIDGCPSLVPNADADAVRLAFDMYVNQDKNYLQIARHFDSLGIKPLRGEIWEKSSISFMLRNVHYVGKVIFGKTRTAKTFENGQLVTKRSMPNNPEDVVIAEGKHQAIVTQELFDAAQAKRDNNPRSKHEYPLVNPLAGLIFCSKCGKALAQHPYKHARTRYECRNRNGCGSKSAPMDEVIDAVIFALEEEELPALMVKLHNNDGDSYVIQKKQIEKMRKELEELHAQEEKQFELLEKGIYKEEKFIERNKLLHTQMDALKSKIFEASQVLPKEVDYEEKIIKLKDAIASLRDDEIPAEAKNKLLKAIIKRIDYEYLAYEGKGKVRYCLHIELLL